MTVELAILSRQGGRERNEDACGHWHSDDFLCCVVADGAGGHGGGDVAARTAVQHVIASCSRQPLVTPAAMEAQLRATNEEVIRHRADSEEVRDMHTTVVVLSVDLRHQTALWGHVGDSRLYLFRQGDLLERTRDHSVVQEMADSGMIEAWEMRGHPKRSALYSALGAAPSEIRVSSSPQATALQPGDVLLLCTDGLWEYCEDEDLRNTLARSASAVAWLAQLEALVLAQAAAAGSIHHDNFSAIAVWFSATEV